MEKILILGVTGMLGSAMFRTFSGSAGEPVEVVGTMRSPSGRKFFPNIEDDRIISSVDVEREDDLVRVFAQVRPSVVINCVGLVKQHAQANNPLTALPINAMLPHRLAALCTATGSRLIHISTDCVFDGQKGSYLESDPSDALDLYGKSKYLGEVTENGAVTLRTSIIGHELAQASSLINWFLAQEGRIQGFTKAIFSGLPTVELAHVIQDYVLPNPELTGLYHVAAEPISKFDLLTLVADIYGKNIEIEKSEKLKIDRSLNGKKFSEKTGYTAPSWVNLIKKMNEFR